MSPLCQLAMTLAVPLPMAPESEDYRFGTSPRAIREGQETSRWHPRHPAGLPPTRRSATRAKGRDLGHGEGGDRCLGGLRSPRWAETCLEKLTPPRSASEPASPTPMLAAMAAT